MNANLMFMSMTQTAELPGLSSTTSQKDMSAMDEAASTFGHIFNGLKATQTTETDVNVEVEAEDVLLEEFTSFLAELDFEELEQVVQNLLETEVESEQLEMLQAELRALLSKLSEAAETNELTVESLLHELSPAAMQMLHSEYPALEQNVKEADEALQVESEPIELSEKGDMLAVEEAPVEDETINSNSTPTFVVKQEEVEERNNPVTPIVKAEQVEESKAENAPISAEEIKLKEVEERNNPVTPIVKAEQVEESKAENAPISAEEIKLEEVEERNNPVTPIVKAENAPISAEEIKLEAEVITQTVPVEVKEQLQNIYQAVENLLLAVQNGESIAKVAPKILQLLEQWQKLTNNNSATQVMQMANPESANKELAKVWEDLLQAFQKRTNFTKNRHYAAEAKVSTKDIARWIGKAVESMQIESTKPTVTNTQNVQGGQAFTPISKVEQFVIHLNQSQQTVSVDKQLVEQFQKLMTANRIMHLQKTSGGLNMTLRPQHLGEMMVRFTQVNGQTMVNIFVTTAQAKDMLEKNMGQLRSMFAPHQVTVERQDSIVQQTAENQKSDEQLRDQQKQENREKNHQDSEEHDHNFSTIFEEIILNEEV